MTPLRIEKITLPTFNAALSRYPNTAPTNLKDLDDLRYTSIPTKLAQSSEKSLQKSDVEKLVEWKLYVSPSLTCSGIC